MNTVSSGDRDKVLDELERYYQEKLAGVRSKRTGSHKPAMVKDWRLCSAESPT
jgi:hypothetical protein